MSKNAASGHEAIASHVIAAGLALVGLIALMHPGFAESGWVEGVVGALAVTMSGLIEIARLAFLHDEALMEGKRKANSDRFSQ